MRPPRGNAVRAGLGKGAHALPRHPSARVPPSRCAAFRPENPNPLTRRESCPGEAGFRAGAPGPLARRTPAAQGARRQNDRRMTQNQPRMTQRFANCQKWGEFWFTNCQNRCEKRFTNCQKIGKEGLQIDIISQGRQFDMLKRKTLQQFEDWYQYRTKQALLVTGARQVGKTYLVREFARKHWKNVVEINLYENQTAAHAISAANNSKERYIATACFSVRNLLPSSERRCLCTLSVGRRPLCG